MNEQDAVRKAFVQDPEGAARLAQMVREGRIRSAETLKPDEALLVVCNTDHAGIVGSKRADCGCGARVWMSPSMQALLKKHQAARTVICLDCAKKYMAAKGAEVANA